MSQLHGVGGDPRRRQSVGDNDEEIRSRSGRCRQSLARFGAQSAAEIWAAQVGISIRSGAIEANSFLPQPREILLDRRPVNGRNHSVARLRMRHGKAQHLLDGQRRAGTSETDARLSETAEGRPRCILAHAAQPPTCSSRAWAGSAKSLPSASARPARASHASNSGARRRPSASRTYSASWKDVDW